jgi:DNA-binding NarL/FixJ family response regulator
MNKRTKKLRILLADDHELVRRGVRSLLHTQRDWRVVGEAKNGPEAVMKAKELKPDIAILDIGMPEIDGLEATRQIQNAVPGSKILVLTMHESDQMVRRMLEAGATGYVLKSDLAGQLVKAVRNVSRGKRFLTQRVSEIVLLGFLRAKMDSKETDDSQVKPTPREAEILQLLAEGKTNKQIAAQLGITVRTAETHRAKIMLKLGLHSITELIHYALRHGIVSINQE